MCPHPRSEDLDEHPLDERLEDIVRDVLHANLEDVRQWVAEVVRERLSEAELRHQVADALAKGTLRRWFDDFVRRRISDDPRFHRDWFAQVIADEASRAVQSLATRDRVAFGDWTRAFALDGGTRAGGALGPAAQHMDGVRWLEPPASLGAGGLEAAVQRDGCALPDTDQREGYYGERHFDFWISGLQDQQAILAEMHLQGRTLAPGDAVLELGCASGRVLRHFAQQMDGLDVWGCDIQRSHVDWLVRHLPQRLKVFQNTVLPSLPIPDGTLDLVYAFSVFTHIDEFELSWIAELARVLKPGGMAYLTVHTEHTWSRLGPELALYHDLMGVRDQVREYDIDESFLAGPMPSERTVFRWTSAQHNNTTVFLDSGYVQSTWGRFLEVKAIRREAAGYQDVVVLRRPTAGR